MARVINYNSKNNVTLSGRIARIRRQSDSVVIFDLVHNFAKAAKLEPLYATFAFFAGKDGKHPIPADLLTVGKSVIVSGYQRPRKVTDDEGKESKYVNLIAGSVEENAEGASKNSIVISGRIAQVRRLDDGIAIFSLAHNFAEAAKLDPVFNDFAFYAGKDGKHPVPADLIATGKSVTVSAFMRPRKVTDNDGKYSVYVNYVATAVEANGEEKPDETPAPEAKPKAKKAKKA